jgi:putative zinc finger protein
MVVRCEQVWLEISNYLEDDVDPGLRRAMEEHFGQCQRCTAVLEGTSNLIRLYGDARLVRTPLGYSWRLRGRLAEALPGPRGTAFGWLVAVAAGALLAGSLTIAHSAARTQPAVRSEQAQPTRAIPDNLMVVVATGSRVFHVPGCTFIHNQPGGIRSMAASEAIHAGYVPCVRCLGQYLSGVARMLIQGHAWVLA